MVLRPLFTRTKITGRRGMVNALGTSKMIQMMPRCLHMFSRGLLSPRMPGMQPWERRGLRGSFAACPLPNFPRVFASGAAPMPEDFASSSGEDLGPFEGPEKLLELWFAAGRDQKSPTSLRNIPNARWQECLDSVNCKILSTISNEHVTAFLLSESSMFVFDEKVYIKTCGTTTLLKCIPGMLKIARDCDLHIVEDLFYSRQNFLFPNQQLSPHSSFDSEISYLHQEFRNGAAFTLGRINGSHYNVFNAEARIKREDKRKEADASVEIMMSGLDQDIMQKHFHKHSFNDQTLHESGIGGLFEGATIDEFAFEPCGYSMNGILGEMVFTIHVTPEVEHSYASFECNAHMGDYTELLHKVLRIFNPSQFMVVTCGKNVSGNKDPSRSAFSQEGVAGYLMQDEALTNFENYKLKYNYFVALSPETEADREEPLIF